MAADARELALSALSRFRRSGRSDSALDAVLGGGSESRDAALAARIFYGVLQNLALCDFYISGLSSVRPSKMETAVLDILRVGIYQIAFLEKVPDRAAVSVCVELCRRRGFERACALVNAVLRRAASEALPEPPDGEPAERLSVLYSHPLWLCGEYISYFGYGGAAALLAENNALPPVTAQVNTLKTDADAAQKALSARGAQAGRHRWLPDCLELTGAGNLTRTPEFSAGEFFVQDAASRLAVKAAGLGPGARVLDICAAPGGKSFAAALDMENRGELIACDLNGKRLTRISQGAERLGLSVISTRKMDAAEPEPSFFGGFDAVLCDAPCSGLGVIRKKPEIRFKNPEDFARLPEIQYSILRGASRCVAPGGVLIYSTCTTRRQENRDVAERFLRENGDFRTERSSFGAGPEQADEGIYELWPHIHGTDGFFICKMRRA